VRQSEELLEGNDGYCNVATMCAVGIAMAQLCGKVFSERIARARARLGVYGEQPKVTSNGENPECIKYRSGPRSIYGKRRSVRLQGRDQRVAAGSGSSLS
jgi:hypothetical protein